MKKCRQVGQQLLFDSDGLEGGADVESPSEQENNNENNKESKDEDVHKV